MDKYLCFRENKEYPTVNFYSSGEDSIYSGIRVIPICKTCITKIAKGYYDSYNDKELAIFLTCIKLDLGFDKEIYDEVVTDKLGIERSIRAYFDAIDSNKKKYSNADEQLYSLGIFNIINEYLKNKELNSSEELDLDYLRYEVTNKDKAFWGNDYSQEEYYYLATTLSDYLDAFSVDTPSSKELLKQICLTTLEIRNLRKVQKQTEDEQVKLKYNKEIDDLTSRLLKILSDNNMKPNQKKNLNDNKESFGTLVEKWEYEEPIPDPFSEWEKNNIFNDVAIWIVGHLRKMLGKEMLPEYEEELEKYTVRSDDD